MKQIFINGRFLARRPTGVDRYAIESIKAIENLIRDNEHHANEYEWTILAPSDAQKPDYLEKIKFKKIGPLKGTIWEQITLPAFCGAKPLVNLCNSAPLIKKNQLVVIHDATTNQVPEAFSKNFVRWYNVLIPALLCRTKEIASISEFSKNEIQKHYKTNRNIHIFREGADHFRVIESKVDAQIQFGLTRPYILAVGSLAPHKNFRALIAAIECIKSPGFDCVIAGGTDPKVFASAGKSLPDWVKHVGYVTDEELKALYSNALLFVFPSIYEGYGLPPIEAMVSGCPVLSSNTASMPEICGEAAEYFSPTDHFQLSRLLQDISENGERRNELRTLGFKRSSTLLWRNSAIDILNVINNGKL